MDVQINYDYRGDDLKDMPLVKLAQFVLDHQEKPQNTEVSLSFVTDEEIARLNEQYRGKEGPTDVLLKTRAMAVDMETATLFTTGFANHIPTGALLLVSDQPMIPEGVKTEQSDNIVTKNFVHEHVEIGIDALRMIIDEKKTVKHLKFDW